MWTHSKIGGGGGGVADRSLSRWDDQENLEKNVQGDLNVRQNQ